MSGQPGEDRVLAQIHEWRDALVNLNRRNRLLYFTVSRSSTVRITDPSLTELLKRLSGRKPLRFHYPPVPQDAASGGHEEASDPRPARPGDLVTDQEDPRALERVLKSIERRSSQEYMDKGIWIQY